MLYSLMCIIDCCSGIKLIPLKFPSFLTDFWHACDDAQWNIQGWWHLQTYKHLKYIKTPLWLRGGKGEVCATAGLLSNSFVYNGDKKLSTLTLALDMWNFTNPVLIALDHSPWKNSALHNRNQSAKGGCIPCNRSVAIWCPGRKYVFWCHLHHAMIPAFSEGLL